MGLIRIAGVCIDKKVFAIIVTVSTLLGAAVAQVDNRYNKQTDFARHIADDEVSRVTTNIAMYDMTLDVIEDRIERETAKRKPNKTRLLKLSKRYEKVSGRQEILFKKLVEIK